jgi:DNA/RNA endonuclease G (NUC1)
MATAEDSIKVWTGNVGEIKKIGLVSVPEKCWKVIFIKKTNTWIGYIFENTKSKPDGIENNQVPISKITELTGFTFR